MATEIQQVRAFISARKRGIEAAEKRYDIRTAVNELCELAAPLHSPERFSSLWKNLYLGPCYRDVVAFLVTYVAVHVEPCFTPQDRALALEVFFDSANVPSSKAIGALVSTLTAVSRKTEAKDSTTEEDREASIAMCVQLLEKVIHDGGIQNIVTELVLQEHVREHLLAKKEKLVESKMTENHNVIGLQVLISQLASLPDVVYNQRQRATPTVFHRKRYFLMLCDSLFCGLIHQEPLVKPSRTFRMFADKLTRIGHSEDIVKSWLSFIGPKLTSFMNAMLFQSLPESCYEQLLLQIASINTPSSLNVHDALRFPKYKLLAQIPPELCESKQFQYIVVHKLLLRKPIDDFLFWRVLVDVMAEGRSTSRQSPLIEVFQGILTRWSQSDFALATEYTINASVCFFIRYSLLQFAKNQKEASFQQDWITMLCKGVQDHMSHSLERVRALGMRVGESLSCVIASEKPLNFDLTEEDPIKVYGCPAQLEELETEMAELHLNKHESSEPEPVEETQGRRKKHSQRQVKSYILDPDEFVESNDENDASSESDFESNTSNLEESDSDMSLEPYDLEDNEEDLKTKKPLYLKDLIAGLLAADDRETTEGALNEAETLLRRQPRDLNDKAHDVVRALLRLEDKYTTPHFVQLRLKALIAACALAPTQTVPYLVSQALEREQVLQSRIDVLQAMTVAAQELSDRGGRSCHSTSPKTLLNEEKDLTTRTMACFKTRRWGYRRDPLVHPTRNAFAPYAVDFFSPLLFGYIAYMRQHSDNAGKARNEVEETFLAHLLHALANFVECAGHSPQTLAMAKCLLEFASNERSSSSAEVRRQVLFSLSRVLLVVPPALLRQEVGQAISEVVPWLHQVQNYDPDAGCREAAQLLSVYAIPKPSFSLM